MKAIRRPLQDNEFQDALQSLKLAGYVKITNSGISLSEPDFREADLEDGVQAFLFSQTCMNLLKLDQASTVFQKTARTGKSGTGIWSRPDFTIATIRRRKYDPFRHLDLFAFELKNLEGLSVVAVHEALAHTRFAHYAYVVCPLSRNNTRLNDTIATECTRHGVGLIRFLIERGADDAPVLRNFELVLSAQRRSADPDDVDTYIDDRFDEELKQSLLSIAGDNR